MSDYDTTPTSTFEKIMRAIIDGTEYTEQPRSVMEALLLELNDLIKNMGGGSLKPAGSKTFSQLGIPSANQLGCIYNITDAFTTNSYFIDGAGTNCPAGTNVYCIVNKDPITEEETYWWDLFGAAIDLSAYLTKTEAGNTYLTKTEGESTYLTKTAAAETYVKDSDATISESDFRNMWDGE